MLPKAYLSAIPPCARNALAQAQQAAAQAIASKGKDGGATGDKIKSPVKQEVGANAKDDMKPPQVPTIQAQRCESLCLCLCLCLSLVD